MDSNLSLGKVLDSLYERRRRPELESLVGLFFFVGLTGLGSYVMKFVVPGALVATGHAVFEVVGLKNPQCCTRPRFCCRIRTLW